MKLKRVSLKVRIFTAALLALLLFIPLVAYALERAYVSSLSLAMLERLRIQTLTLISEFEYLDNVSSMPEIMINGQFNLPNSGLYGFVATKDLVIWRSLSALNWELPKIPRYPNVGKEQFIQVQKGGKLFFLHSYTAEYQKGDGFSSFVFHVFQDKDGFEADVLNFRAILWRWLAIISGVLLVLLLFTFYTALRPINRLDKEIAKVEKGNNDRIKEDYPPELEKLKSSLNQLLTVEEQQRERYKNGLGDLAHSLKTPLAVLSGLPDLPEQGVEPVEQINNIIQRQLKRAVAGTGSRWNQRCAIAPTAKKLVNAMNKVYADKSLTIREDIPEEAEFYGDDTDLMEMLGNLLDNACKAAKSEVIISSQVTGQFMTISVSDDGPGIPEEKRQLLLERGHRLDSYESGQGIGMSVVSDLVSAYEGQLHISDSKLGGAQISLRFQSRNAVD